MSYNISSDQFSNPLLKELLQELTDFFNSVGSEFYVIGATARDIIMSGIHAQHSGRKTDALEITIDHSLTVRVASLPGIFILKLIAWNDRHLVHDRDAEDMAFIISNYLNLNDERAAHNHYDIYDQTPFSSFVAGATLIARDIRAIIRDDLSVRDSLSSILRAETEKNLVSPLINQILETHPSLKYEEVYDAILAMNKELNK